MANKNNRDEKIRNQRLFQLVEFIRNGNYPNVPMMKKEYEVSRSTIMRDLEFLKSRYMLQLNILWNIKVIIFLIQLL